MTPFTDADFDFRGVWLTPRQACCYIPCRSVRAWYQWRARHGIITRANGTVAKADLDRALKVKRKTKQGLHANSRKNLTLSRTRTPAPVAVEAADSDGAR